MNDERALAALRASERVLQIAWRWLPYPNETPEHALVERDVDDILLVKEAELIRAALKDVEFAVLGVAEDRGAKA